VAWTSNKPPAASVKKTIRDNGSVVVVPENPTVSGAVTVKLPTLKDKGAGASGKLNDSEKAELGELRGEPGTFPAYVPLMTKSIVSACVTAQPKASNISRKPPVDNTLRMALTPSVSLTLRSNLVANCCVDFKWLKRTPAPGKTIFLHTWRSLPPAGRRCTSGRLR